MKVFAFLADAAQVDQQTKVHALGLNWTHMPTPTLPMAVVAFAELEPEDLPAALSVRIELLDAEEQPVDVPADTEGNYKPLAITGVGTASEFEGPRKGEPIMVPFVTQIGPGLPLKPGFYSFRVTVKLAESGESGTAEVRFRVREPSEE